MGEFGDMVSDTKRGTAKLMRDYPDQMKAFSALADACEKDGALSKKTKELISVALAVKAQCRPCIAFHVRHALDSGASRAEIIEAAWVAVLMGGGPSLTYSLDVLKAVDEMGGK